MTTPPPTSAARAAAPADHWRDALLRAAGYALQVPMCGLLLADGASWSLALDDVSVEDRTRATRVHHERIAGVASTGEAAFLAGSGAGGAPALAAVPFTDAAQVSVGCLWVATLTARTWTAADRDALHHFARALSDEIGRHGPGGSLWVTRPQRPERFRTLFETAPFGVLIGDLRVQHFETNPAWRRIFWWWKGNPFEDVVRYTHPEDLDTDVGLFQELLSGGRDTYRIEKRYVQPDGSLLWGELTLVLVRDGAGEPAWLYTTAEDITHRKALEADLARISTIDELTGLANRRGFFAHAERELQLARRRGEDLLVIYLDVDGFKRVNDTYGHAAGDHLLRDAAELVRSCFRTTDVCARIRERDGRGVAARVGGDEFVVLAAAARDGAEEAIAERLAAAVAEYNAAGTRPYALSLSLGITRYRSGESDASADVLLARADQRMYEHKRSRGAD